MRNFSNKSCRKSWNTHYEFKSLFRNSHHLRDNVEKYGGARQATDNNIIKRMRFVCWTTKATDTPSNYVIFISFLQKQWLRNAPQYSVYAYSYIACLATFPLICVEKETLYLTTLLISKII